jgi:hypothetical protein
VDDAGLIWNRACDIDYQPSRPGDVALQSIIRFHGLSMNGGIAHALELNFEQSERVAQHYRFFGADNHAATIEQARQIAIPGIAADGNFDSLSLTDEQAEELDALDAQLPDDSDLEAIFGRYLAAHPDAFDHP